jgi:hypothetical protein
MSQQFDGDLLEVPGATVDLRAPSEDYFGMRGAKPIAEVLAALEPLVRPLAADLITYTSRLKGDQRQWRRDTCWYFVERGSEQELALEPGTGCATTRRVDRLTPSAVAELVADALMSEASSDEETSWREMRMLTTEVRVPESLAEREHVSLRRRGSDVGARVLPRADGAWVRAHHPGEPSPIALRLSGPEWVTLRVTVHWSLWTPGGGGAADFEDAIAQLLSRGWSILRASDEWSQHHWSNS